MADYIETREKTVYVVDGVEYDTLEDAEVAARVDALDTYLAFAGECGYEFSTRKASEAMLRDKDRVIALLGGMAG